MPTTRPTSPRTCRLRRGVAVVGLVAAVAAAAIPAAAVAGPRSSRAAAPALLAGRSDGPLVPRQGALFGTWIRRGAGGVAENLAALGEREAQIGRRFDISQHFYPFDKPFPSAYEADDIAQGRTPMIAWNGNDADAIAAGDHDALIDQRGRALAAMGVPVFLRWFWEPEAKTDRMSSPAAYIAAWRRVHQRVRAAGATNVVWVWCPTSYGFTNGVAARYYPGDDVVDWVCADGYNWAPGRGDQWRDWAWIYRPAHTFAVAHDKPLMAGEWGVQERNPGEKAAWMDAARAAIRTELPNLAAVVAFDENRLYDWRVDATPESLAAFDRWADDPWFNTRTGNGGGGTGNGGGNSGGTGPGPADLLLRDDFAAGLAKWQGRNHAEVRNGALSIATTTGGGYAVADLADTAARAWAEVSVRIDRRGSHSVRLLTLRDADGKAIVGVGVRRTGALTIVDDRTGVRSATAARLVPGRWTTLRLRYDATAGTTEVTLAGSRATVATRTSLRSTGAAAFELGDRGGRSLAKRFAVSFRAVRVDDAALAAA